MVKERSDMKTRIVGVILLGMLTLSACSSQNDALSDQSIEDQSSVAVSEETDEEMQQKIYENQLLYKFIGLAEDTFPEKIQRALYWQDRECSETLMGTVMVPILDENGMQDMNWFCDDICEWMEISLAEIPYDEAPWIYKEIIISMYPSEVSFDPSPYISNGYDREALYSGLYEFLDDKLNAPDGQAVRSDSYEKLEFTDDGSGEGYEDYEAECTYTTGDGITYGMIPVDRAAGSSYYVLTARRNSDGKVILVNDDPYCGSGGAAGWITFIDDTTLGFSCLTYNGGDDAFLYRTADGGRSFTQINYPSAKVKLADGSIYNPFTIPEKVWKDGEDLYMLVGQSPYSGDYYSEELGKHPSGLYVSHDDGISFEYIGEQ